MGKGQRVGPGDARGPHPVPGSSGNVAGQVWAVPPPSDARAKRQNISRV